MQVVPLNHNRVPKPHTADTKMHKNHGKTVMGQRRGEMDSITPIRQSDKGSGRHIVCDNQLDCIAADRVPGMTMKSNPSPVRNKIQDQIRVSCRLVRLGIDI